MLNFIVLGLIPGTHLQITFSWVLLSIAALFVYLELRYRRYHGHLTPQFESGDLASLIDEENQAALPVQTTLALRIPKTYRVDLVIWGRQYTLAIEL